MDRSGFSSFHYEVTTIADFSKNSPKLRLSALGYLLDNGFLVDGATDDRVDLLFDAADKFVAFVSDGQEDFINELHSLDTSEVAEVIKLPSKGSPEADGYL